MRTDSLRIAAFCLLIFPLLTARIAHADFTIATVDVNRVLNESTEAKSKRKELDELSSKAKSKIESKKKSLQDMEKKIKDGDVKEGSPEAEKFREEARDFARFVKDSETDIKGEFMKYNRDLTERTLKLITQYAKSNNIDMVLDKSVAVRGPVLYGSDTADITEAIIAQVNQ